jgi:hypothetical protein
MKLPANWDQYAFADRARWLYVALLSEKKSDWCGHVAALFDRLDKLERVAREAGQLLQSGVGQTEPAATPAPNLEPLKQSLAALDTA